MHRVAVGQRVRDEGVATLVVGDDLLFLLAHQPALALRPGHHAVDGLLERDVGDQLLVVAGGEQRRLVDHIGEVGTGEARGAPRDHRQIDVGSHWLALGVHRQDALAALEVRPVDDDLPVEATRTQQRGVEDVRAVRRGDQDHAALDVEAVHLDQQLVEGLLPLVVPAAETGAAVASDRVDLVYEDDRRGVGLRLLEQVADAGRTDTDEHLDEVRTGDGVEGHAGLTGDGAGKQRLTGTGRPVQQDALGDLGADGLELGRVLQELFDLVELLDRLVRSGDVGERGLRGVLADELGLALAELHDAAAAALHLVHEEQQQRHDDDDRQQAEQDAEQQVLGRRVDLVVDVLRFEGGGEAVTLLQQEERLLLLAALAGHLDPLFLHREPGSGDVVVLDRIDDGGGVDLLVVAVATAEGARGEQKQDRK